LVMVYHDGQLFAMVGLKFPSRFDSQGPMCLETHGASFLPLCGKISLRPTFTHHVLHSA